MTHRPNEPPVRFEGAVHEWLVQHRVTVLRISLGVAFLGFGVLKLTGGLVPARAGGDRAAGVLDQDVLKDLFLVSAAMVIATAFRGARIVTPEDWSAEPDAHASPEVPATPVDTAPAG